MYMSRRCNSNTTRGTRCGNAAVTGGFCTLHHNRRTSDRDDAEIINLLNDMSIPETALIPFGFGPITTTPKVKTTKLSKVLESQSRSPRTDEKECSICLESPVDRINTRCCKKPFCKKCIKKSLINKPQCPACRADKAGFSY